MRWEWTFDEIKCSVHNEDLRKTAVTSDNDTGATEWVVYTFRCGCVSPDFAESS